MVALQFAYRTALAFTLSSLTSKIILMSKISQSNHFLRFGKSKTPHNQHMTPVFDLPVIKMRYTQSRCEPLHTIENASMYIFIIVKLLCFSFGTGIFSRTKAQSIGFSCFGLIQLITQQGWMLCPSDLFEHIFTRRHQPRQAGKVIHIKNQTFRFWMAGFIVKANIICCQQKTINNRFGLTMVYRFNQIMLNGAQPTNINQRNTLVLKEVQFL